jgi:hypothetical protein
MTSARQQTARDLEAYLRAVDNQLLVMPWRQRTRAVSDLRAHLAEDPSVMAQQPPSEYAQELLQADRKAAAELPGGIRSFLWPTPREWFESWLRGLALVFLLLETAWVVTALVDHLVSGSGQPLGQVWGAVYPTPTFRGSSRDGLVLTLLASWLLGQQTTAMILRRNIGYRERLPKYTVVAAILVVALYGVGFLTQAG